MSTLSNRYRIFIGVFAPACLLATSACGQLPKPYVPSVSPSSIQGSVNYSDPTLNGGHPELTDFTCPAEANLHPSDGSGSGGVGTLTVCAHKDNTSDVMLFTPAGNDAINLANKVCAFPVEKVDDTHVYAKPVSSVNPQAMVQCQKWNPAGTKFSFAYTHYNALIVVTDAHLSEMQQFLNQMGLNLYDAYSPAWKYSSSGSFR